MASALKQYEHLKLQLRQIHGCTLVLQSFWVRFSAS
uniref:Uncharacterized protein n=1 Tax=Arundo donax TaxID=35708 RepID=A0A0A9BYV2_ARUDO